MPRYIVKVGNRYGFWSSVVDAPVSRLMPLDEFRDEYRVKYGTESMDDLERRLERVERTGCSCHFGGTMREYLALNRCGPNEERLPVDEVIAMWERDSDADTGEAH